MKYLKSIMILVLVMSFQVLIAQENDAYYFSKKMKGDFEEIVTKTKDVLKEQGFGVITEIEMEAKLKEKLPDLEMKPYRILGVCNPQFAVETLKIDENIGLFLPCKVLVKDLGNGAVEVVMINPSAMMEMLGNPELVKVADEVTSRFRLAMKKL